MISTMHHFKANTAALIVTLLAGFIASSSFARSEISNDPNIQDGWRLVRDRSEIRVYMKHTEASKIKTFRGIRIFELEDPSSIIAVMFDVNRLGDWLQYIRSVELLEKVSDTAFNYRIVTNLPWPLKDRETLMEVEFVQDLENYSITMIAQSNNELLPPNDRYIRMPSSRSTIEYRFLGQKKVQVTYEAHVDPGGYVPPFLVNLILSDAATFSLKRLPVIMQKDEYQGRRQEHPAFQWPY